MVTPPPTLAQMAAANDAHKRAKRELEWEPLCPPLYRATDIDRLSIDSQKLSEILNWQKGDKGIGLTGDTGAGKTRVMFLLMHQLHMSGERIMVTTAKQFSRWCQSMFEKDDDAVININLARKRPILFIDDVGKEKYTEHVESEFYDLVEHRTSHLLPIFWTANATGEELLRMMGEDRGMPIVRRLREFSTIISL